MLIHQNFNVGCKAFNFNMLNLKKFRRVVFLSRFALGFAMLFVTSELMMAAPRDSQSNLDDTPKSQSPATKEAAKEAVGVNMDENIRLRRDLDEYSRSVDPAHVQIEERRRVMHKHLQERFAITDRDNDGTISLDEAYELSLIHI